MASFSRGNLARAFAVAGAMLTLGACAVSSPIAVTSDGSGLASVKAVHLESAETEESARIAFEAALRRAFARESIALDKSAQYLADFAIALRSAETGLAQPQDIAPGSNEVDWTSDPRKKRLFDRCSAQRIRATLVILDRQVGTVAYRGEGEADACAFEMEDYDRLATALVQDALGTPTGLTASK